MASRPPLRAPPRGSTRVHPREPPRATLSASPKQSRGLASVPASVPSTRCSLQPPEGATGRQAHAWGRTPTGKLTASGSTFAFSLWPPQLALSPWCHELTLTHWGAELAFPAWQLSLTCTPGGFSNPLTSLGPRLIPQGSWTGARGEAGKAPAGREQCEKEDDCDHRFG